MTQIVIAFSSRSDSIGFNEYLSRAGVPTTLANTPRELSIGCGIAVRVEERYLEIVKHLLNSYGNRVSFVGLFKLTKMGAKTLVSKI